MSLANYSDIAFASQIPTDKIAFIEKDSFSPSSATSIGFGLKRHSVQHDLPRPVFTKVKWSLDNDTWRDGGISGGGAGGSGSNNSTIAYCDETYIYILTTATSGTIYYEVMGFWIDNYDGSNPLVEPLSGALKDIYFDSRLATQKIYDQAEISLTPNIEDSADIAFDLTSRPNVRAYFEAFPGQIWPANYGGIKNPFLYDFSNQAELDIRIYDKYVQLYSAGYVGAPTRRVWYVIYYNEE